MDLTLERRVQILCRQAIREGVAASAHDCSDGGLAVALAESCIQGDVGFTGALAVPRRWDMTMFGEGQSRIVISLSSEQWPQLEEMARQSGVPLLRLGTTGGSNFRWGHQLDLPISTLADSWRGGLDVLPAPKPLPTRLARLAPWQLLRKHRQPANRYLGMPNNPQTTKKQLPAPTANPGPRAIERKLLSPSSGRYAKNQPGHRLPSRIEDPIGSCFRRWSPT